MPLLILPFLTSIIRYKITRRVIAHRIWVYELFSEVRILEKIENFT